ncbi:PQQ-binding-like beta-propeller repeat protein [Treponema putidum]|uniref:outer membrane protein assembly factor BamB family protein n=1 Tax=Treponema putidum TaxID=221027 RepID=UPI003D8E25B3
MKKSFFSIFFCFFVFSFKLPAQPLDAHWTLVFAGKNITVPVFWNGNIYTAGDDKALNCITSQGTFLWRRNTSEFPSNFLSVSQAGLVYMVTAKGNIEAFSSQGMPLWTYPLKKKPIFPVHTARDGRIFIIQEDNIICLTSSGKLKWEIPLVSAPIFQPSETGSKDIVLILKSGDFLRVSIFGSVVEQRRLKKTVSAIGEAPEGYILACTDGSISYYKTGGGSEALWQTTEPEICRNAFYKGGKVLYMFESGKLIFKDLKTNELIWEEKTSGNFSGGVHCYAIGNEFNITAKGFGCLITDSGRIKWEKKIPETDFFPIITENGLLVGITNEILNAYRVETKLLRKGTKISSPDSFYSIVQKDDKGKDDLPFFVEYATAAELLDAIQKEIENGAVGEKEPRYAFQLKTILENKRKASYFAQDFNAFDRARAAELLGRLGSYEYRDILLNGIYKIDDPDVLAGILRGLEHLAYDPDGKTMEGIRFVMGKAKYDDINLMAAVCDCLTALMRFGDQETSRAAISSLFYVIKGPYSNIIQNYARQKLKNIVQ